MVEAVWSETPVSPSEPSSISLTSEKRTSLRPDKALGLVSPSVGRRAKGQRATNGKSHKNAIVEGEQETKWLISQTYLKRSLNNHIMKFLVITRKQKTTSTIENIEQVIQFD